MCYGADRPPWTAFASFRATVAEEGQLALSSCVKRTAAHRKPFPVPKDERILTGYLFLLVSRERSRLKCRRAVGRSLKNLLVDPIMYQSYYQSYWLRLTDPKTHWPHLLLWGDLVNCLCVVLGTWVCSCRCKDPLPTTGVLMSHTYLVVVWSVHWCEKGRALVCWVAMDGNDGTC